MNEADSDITDAFAAGAGAGSGGLFQTKEKGFSEGGLEL